MAKKRLQPPLMQLEGLAPPADAPASPEAGPVYEPPKVTEANRDNWIDDLAGALTDPIIVYPGGWGDPLPDKLKGDISMYRLIQMMQRLKGDPEGELATWPEVCWYLSCASLEFPFDHDWAQIYMYAFTKYRPDAVAMEGCEDLRVEKLNITQREDLARFRRWLYSARKRAREDKRRGEKRVEREERKAAQAEASAEPSPQMALEMLIPDEYEAIIQGGR